MRILLTTLNSKYVHANLALKYLYMAAEQHCEQLEIKEFTINNSRDYIFSELVCGEYDAVCFSCYIWNIKEILELSENLKKARPEIKIILGGPEVTFEAEEFILAHKYIDFLLVGEGELIFNQLCQVFNGVSDYSKVRGLVYRENGRVFVNPPMPPLVFESVPFPYNVFPCESDKVLYYESSRGCPYNCSYCISSLDRKMRALSLERVKQDLSYFILKGVKQVKFLDRTFNWDKERSLEIFSFIIAMDKGKTNFHFELCGDLLDEETFRVLSKARKGLFQFEIGIQSTNKRTLQVINRTTDTEKLLDNVKKLVEMENIHIHVDLIAGLPFEDYETFRQSFNDVYVLGAENLQLGFLKLLKGTEIRETASAYGYEYMGSAPYEVISNEVMTAKELCRLKQVEAVLDLYHNRGGFEHTLKHIINDYAQSPFHFYEDLAKFYHTEGFQHKSHKKEDLYRIFYQYVHTVYPEEKMDELLEFDLENTMNLDVVKDFKKKGWELL